MIIYEKDYIMRIISNLVNFLAKIVFGKSNAVYEISEDVQFKASDDLHKELLELLSKGEINEAENLLFDRFDPNDKRQIMVAIDFYRRLNSFDDEFLEKSNFTREEIEEGLRDIANKAGIILYE